MRSTQPRTSRLLALALTAALSVALAPQAHADSGTPGGCPKPVKVLKHHAPVKHAVAKKVQHKKTTKHIKLRGKPATVSAPSTVTSKPQLQTPSHPVLSAKTSEYRRIVPEPTCNMEPPFAVPACQSRLKALGYDL